MKKSFTTFVLIILASTFFAQDWIEMASKPNANLYKIQEKFYNNLKDADLTKKSNGYKPFKRWEHFVGPRVYPTGDISLLSQASKNYSDFLANYNSSINQNNKINNSGSSLLSTPSWSAAGPIGAMSGFNDFGQPHKAGRDNFITLPPFNSQLIYAGAAGGGLWQSIDAGTTWTTNTDNLPVTAVSDLAIDPTNPNIMYLATGGGDDVLSGNPVASDGLYKTTDGGVTWNAAGLTFPVSLGRVIHKVVLDPINSQIVFVATNAGIYRSTNAGSSFTSVSSINCWDLKFHPTNANILYAAGTAFYRSTNAGLNFSLVNAGIPTSGSNRMAIAVTPVDPSNVYVLASKSSDSQFMGVYRSTNNGVNFTIMSNSPNIIGHACDGSSTGQGQGWYDLTIAASPINSNEIVVGGVNVWQSFDGGSNWSNIGCWFGSHPFIHADIHELEYMLDGTLYSANDGGVYSYTGSSWTDLSGSRNIAQIYKIGLSSLTANKWITGHQDNGTNIKNVNSYDASLSGDGMDCFIDRTNDNILFGEQYNGSLNRSIDGGLTWTSIVNGITGVGDWVTPWKQDPVNTTIYAGFNQLFKSTNNGTNWTQMGTTGGSGSIVEFAIAPSNNQVIYVLYSGTVRKTINGGNTWTNVTNGVSGGAFTFITIDPNDANTAWLTMSGYTAGKKVFQTTDGGSTWMNISSNLPNLPANCSVYETGSNDRIYIGMDVGVYYKDNSSTTWTLYNTGLPNVVITDMEMTPANPGKLYAATYGRGVYEVDVVPVIAAAPVSNFSYSGSLCVGNTKTLIDNSTNTPTSWSWSIAPTTGVTYNSLNIQNPSFTFSTTGIYTVSLLSGNSFGQGPISTQTLLVSAAPNLVLSTNSITSCNGNPVTVVASGANTYTWSNGGGSSAMVTYSPSGDWTYTLTGSNNGCLATTTLSVVMGVSPVVVLSTTTLTACVQESISISATGATSYTWSNGGGNNSTVTYTPTSVSSTTYAVTGQNADGCFATEIVTINVLSCVGIIELKETNTSFHIYPNPTVDNLILKMKGAKSIDITLEVYDLAGKLALKHNANFNTEKPEYRLNMAALINGVYLLKIISQDGTAQTLRVLKE